MADSNTDSHKNYYTNQVTKQKWKEEFYKKTVEQLQTEERFVTYFKQFNPKSAEEYIKYYATRKVNWFESATDLRNWEKRKVKERMKDCFSAFIEIQQRKLFNAQCLWRAEKIKLQDIEICYDFKYWENHIFGCRDISPINEEDIELYTRFLRETPYNLQFDDYHDYQEYDDFKTAKRETGSAFEDNSWYSYYDIHEGTGYYLDLPDIRGQKEEKYMDIYRDDDRAKNPEKYVYPNPKADNRPSLDWYGGDFMANFVKTHETPAFYRMYLQDVKDRELNELNEKVDYNLAVLEEIPIDYLAIEPADDWRTAVALTVERYRRENVISLLPEAFEMYLKHLGHDWNYPGKSEYADRYDSYKSICKHWKETLISARVLNGEPADLNF